MNNIQSSLLEIKTLIQKWEIQYHRNQSSVSLLAVSKKQSIDKIKQAIQAGHVDFGESYIQEGLEKILHFNNENLSWHFIGSIQSNKTKRIAEHFAWVHTVCDFKIAERLNKQRPSDKPPLNICIQVNSSRDQAKSGVLPENVIVLAEYCLMQPQLKLRGLMTIPTLKKTFDEQRVELRKLRTIYDDLNKRGFNLDILSMGMSADMQAAIAEGATMLRIGTAIFGERS